MVAQLVERSVYSIECRGLTLSHFTTAWPLTTTYGFSYESLVTYMHVTAMDVIYLLVFYNITYECVCLHSVRLL